MFNLSTKEVVSSIEKSPLLVKEGIYYQHYNNFFGKEILEELNSLENLKFEKLERQLDFPRQRIDYSETIMKKLKIFFSSSHITNSLGKKFDRELTFESVDVWFDSKGYTLAPHTDDSRIKLAIQIYLGTGDNIGTCLYDGQENIIETFQYKFNCGYALLNNAVSLHGTTGVVDNDLRKSLYVRYQ